MPWPEDVPDMPMSKPKQLLNLEKLGPDRLNAMTKQEAEERIQEAGYALANNYRREVNDDFDDCVQTVSTALKVTGSSVGGTLGALMVAECENVAREACKVVLTDDTLEY